MTFGFEMMFALEDCGASIDDLMLVPGIGS